MTKLVISTFVENGRMTVTLNGEKIIEDSNRIETELEYGKDYQLAWKVDGRAGSMYNITVSSPVEISFYLSKTIGKTGYDFNKVSFIL